MGVRRASIAVLPLRQRGHVDEGPRMVDGRLVVAGNGPMVQGVVEPIVEPGIIGLGRGNFDSGIDFERRDVSL